MASKFLGVDAGATKTRAVLYDAAGVMLYESIQGHGNIIVNEAIALQNVTNAIAQCLEQVSEIDQISLLLGMAGIDISNKSKQVKRSLEIKFPTLQQVAVINDGYLGMIAALKGRDGVFVVSGTGSVVYGQKQDTRLRVGGYGHLLGDEGSAYWIGYQLFKGLTYFIDTKQPVSPFYQAFLTSEGVSEENAYDLIRKFYTLTKQEVAEYALWVSHLAENENNEAIRLLKKAARVLAKQVKLILNRLAFTPNFLFAFSGSVLVKNPVVLAALLEQLPDVTLLKEVVEPTKAVYYYWTREENRCLQLV